MPLWIDSICVFDSIILELCASSEISAGSCCPILLDMSWPPWPLLCIDNVCKSVRYSHWLNTRSFFSLTFLVGNSTNELIPTCCFVFRIFICKSKTFSRGDPVIVTPVLFSFVAIVSRSPPLVFAFVVVLVARRRILLPSPRRRRWHLDVASRRREWGFS